MEDRIKAFGLITRYWTFREDLGYGCSECCNGDRCDEDCDAPYKGRRHQCPHCKGEGWIKKVDAELLDGLTSEEYRKKNSISNVSGVGIQKP